MGLKTEIKGFCIV